MKFTSCILLFLSTLAVAQPDQWKDVYKESAWADRDHWQRADDLIRFLKLKSGSVVADVGCHQGYMTMKLSPAVGAKGKVLAVDVEQYKLDQLKKILLAKGIQNVQLIKGAYDDPKLNTTSLDAAIILDTYHEMKDHDKILQHIRAAMRPGARLVICEPIAEARRQSLRETQEGKHELGMNYAKEDLEKAGFKIVETLDPFADREKVKGDKMWVIVAEK